MKRSFFLLPFLFAKKIKSETIRNKNVPSCINCKFSQKGFITSNNYLYCKKFGEKNIITDKVNYDFADFCRKDENKCGKQANYYEEDKFSFLKKTSPASLYISFFLFYIWVLVTLSNRIK